MTSHALICVFTGGSGWSPPALVVHGLHHRHDDGFHRVRGQLAGAARVRRPHVPVLDLPHARPIHTAHPHTTRQLIGTHACLNNNSSFPNCNQLKNPINHT